LGKAYTYLRSNLVTHSYVKDQDLSKPSAQDSRGAEVERGDQVGGNGLAGHI